MKRASEPWRAAAVTAGLFLLWLTPSLGQLVRYLGPIGVVIASGLAAAAMAWAWRWRARPAGRLDRWGSLWLAAALALAFVILFPVSRGGLLGPGSDRADALDVALRALFAGAPPYQTHTFLGNGPTPLPGALLIAAPFHLLGASALQNLLWGPLFAILAPAMTGGRRAGVTCVAVLVLLSPAAMQDFVTGGDYLVNAFYVAIAMLAVMRASETGGRAARLAAAAFFAVAASSRAIYAVEAPILAAWALQRGGVRAGVDFALSAGLAALAINLPLFAADPAHFPLFKSQSKLAWLPPGLHAGWLLPALAAAISAGAFAVRLTPGRVYLISAVALGVMLVPPVLWPLAVAGSTPWLLIQLGFLLPVSVFGGLWLFSLAGKDQAGAAR